MVAIAKAEGLDVEQQAAVALVEQVGNDIRQVLHSMQMWKAKSNTMKYSDLARKMDTISKDKVLRQSPFEAAANILAGKRYAFDERYNGFFIDYSLIPLLIQENYIAYSRNGIFKNNTIDEGRQMEELAKAAHAVSDMELVGASLMGNDQHWELLPAQAAFGLRVGSLVDGFQAFPTFPGWLGKNSSRGKSHRLVSELVTHTSIAIRQGFTPMRLDYIPYLRSKLLKPIISNGTDGINECIEILDYYGLSKDDFTDTLKDFQFTCDNVKDLKDNFAGIETNTRSALTRTYNQMGHKSQALVSEQGGNPKKRKASQAALDALDVEAGTIEELDATVVDDDKDDDDVGDVSAFVKKRKQDKAKEKKEKAAPKAAPKATKKAKK
jgi:replication factor C subunit 1